MAIIAFISQKGGVGKSTLARALACEAQKNQLSVKLADLDTQQGTSTEWHRVRLDHGLDSVGSVEVFGKVKKALEVADNYDLLILDGAPRASSASLEIAKEADLLILPSGASRDDLMPTILLGHELVKKNIPRNKVHIALTRVSTEAEIKEATDFIEQSGHNVLNGYLPERPAYRQAQNEGLAVTETRYPSLNKKADAIIQSISDLL